MVSVFLSYGHEDEAFANRLAGHLRHYGVRVWLDKAELQIGDDLKEKLRSAVAEQDFLAVILSKQSLESPWVKFEIDQARKDEKAGRRSKVLPIVIDSCELPAFLQGKVHADFRDANRYFAELSRLLRPMDVTVTEEALRRALTEPEPDSYIDALPQHYRDWGALTKIVLTFLGSAFLSAVGMKFFGATPFVLDSPKAAAVLLMQSSLGPGVVLAIVFTAYEETPGCLVIPFVALLFGALGFVLGLPFFLFDISVTLSPAARLWTAAGIGGVIVALPPLFLWFYLD